MSVEPAVPTEATRRASAIRIVPHTDAEQPAVEAFNQRMRAGRAATDFLLPDRPNPPDTSPLASIRWEKYLAVDGERQVRGGYLLMRQRGWLNGRPVPVVNYQAPVSEGILDKRHGMVGMHMLRHLEREHPLAFVVGMGGRDRPLPRLLSAAGWTIAEVPFLFRILDGGRVFRELQPLQKKPWLRRAARLAAGSGAAWLATRLLHARGVLRHPPLEARRVEAWGEWADRLWERVQDQYSFAVIRDRSTLERLYPTEEGRYAILTFASEGKIVGWAACAVTAMRQDAYFGDLRVATVLDAVCLPGAARALAAAVPRVLREDADLVVTNQSHHAWIDAFRRAGFATAPSNYLLAASRRLAHEIGEATDRVHVTRGDGDGRIHLV